MKHLNLAFVVIACSSSAAQELHIPADIMSVGIPIQTTQVVILNKLIKQTEIVKQIDAETKPTQVRKSVRNNALEYEWFSKISMNEGNFNIEESERLLQTLENMRDMRPDKSLLQAMYIQCARVTRQKPFTDMRQVWVSYLPMNGDSLPEKGWIECTGRDSITKKSLPLGCSGSWKLVSKKWVKFRDQIRTLYYSGIIPNVIPGKPKQWGGDMDYWRGVGRDFCPLNIGGRRLNTFWGDPKDPENLDKCLPIDQDKVKSSKILTAAIASGRHQSKPRIQQLVE